MTRLRVWMSALAAVASVGTAIHVVFHGGWLSQAEIDAAFDAGLQRFEDRMRPSLPKQIDDRTALIDVHHIGKVLTYTYLISFSSNRVDASVLTAKLKHDITSSSCGAKEIRFALDNGVTFRYVYKDLNARELGRFDVTKVDCENAEVARTI